MESPHFVENLPQSILFFKSKRKESERSYAKKGCINKPLPLQTRKKELIFHLCINGHRMDVLLKFLFASAIYLRGIKKVPVSAEINSVGKKLINTGPALLSIDNNLRAKF